VQSLNSYLKPALTKREEKINEQDFPEKQVLMEEKFQRKPDRCTPNKGWLNGYSAFADRRRRAGI
jgi:hypothetical protein